MGKGAKVQVSEYYMSQHFGVCTTVDVLRKIIIKEKLAWSGYLTAQTWWRIKEEQLFGGNKKEGGAVGTIYFLPGFPDQVLYDELATRLGRANGADAPGYRGITSLFFTGRPDDNDGARGFNWSANNPYLPTVWAEVRRAPVGLTAGYAMVPRAGSDFFPFTSTTGVASLLNSALTPDGRSLIATYNTGGLHYIQVWDLATRALVSENTSSVDVAGHDFGVASSTTFYALHGGPQLLLFDTDGGWSLVTDDFAASFSGVQYVAGQILLLPLTSGTMNYGFFNGAGISAATVGFNITHFFEDDDGAAWGIGPKRSGGDIGLVEIASGVVTFVHTGFDTDCAAVDNGLGQFFVFQQNGRAFLIDKATLTIAHTSAVATLGDDGPDLRRHFSGISPGVATVWVGYNEYDTRTGELARAVDPFDWKSASSTRTIYDKVNHSIIAEEPFTATTVTWRDLDRGELDANPAHVIFEALTNTDWGMGSPTTLIDVDSFEDAGVALYNEPLGLSLLWTRQSAIQDFIQEVLDHIQAVLFVDPQTGLLTLKLIRGDYVVADLPTISPSTANLTNFGRKLWGEIVNEISVTWTNPDNEQDETVTVHDLASITTQGGIVSDSRNYYGVRYALLAQRLAARDLRSAGAPLATCEAEVDRSLWALRPASVLLLDWPEYGLDGVVMRVTSIDYGKPGDPSIKLSLIEDVFGLDVGDYVEPPSTAWEDTAQAPTALDDQQALTLPYFFAVNGIAPFTDATYPEVLAGALAATSNGDTFSVELWGEVVQPDGSSEWESLSVINVVGRGELAAILNAEASSTAVSFDSFVGSTSPQAGGFVIVGNGVEGEDELAMITAAGSTYSLSRGILDTVPRAWPATTPVWFVGADTLIEDPTLRSAGEVVSYKLRTRTSQGLLGLAAAPLLTYTLTERPWLPSRPANLTIGGAQFNTAATPANMIGASVVPVTWSNRNRLAEDSLILDWADSTVTVETGQTTTITVLKTDGVTVLDTITALGGSSYNIPIASFGSEAIALVRLSASRTDADGTFESLQSHGIYVQLDMAAPVGRADEVDTALARTLVLVVATGRANETDNALALGAVGPAPVGSSNETDTAIALTNGVDLQIDGGAHDGEPLQIDGGAHDGESIQLE